VPTNKHSMAVHEATFECFVAHLNELVERVGYVAPGTPLPDSVQAPVRRRSACPIPTLVTHASLARMPAPNPSSRGTLLPPMSPCSLSLSLTGGSQADETATVTVHSLDLTNDAEFVRLLQAVATVAESQADVLNSYIEGMMLWRDAQRGADDGPNPVYHAVEVLFGVTVLRILLVPSCAQELHDKASDSLEEIASSCLLLAVARTRTSGARSFVAPGLDAAVAAAAVQMRFGQRDVCDATAIDTDADPFSFHELYFPREGPMWFDSMVVVEVYARIIGVLSHTKLYSVTPRFLPRLDTAVRITVAKDKASRQTNEAVEIVRILRYVRLGVHQLDYSVDFLTKIATLTEQQRVPMELKHELCALLAACLERIAADQSVRRAVMTEDSSGGRAEGLPAAQTSAWDHVIARLYRKVNEWAAKPKHAGPACRALAALLISFSTDSYIKQLNEQNKQPLIQLLVKNCGDRSLRTVMLASFRAIVRLSSPARGFANSKIVEDIELGLVQLECDSFRRQDTKGKAKSKEDNSLTAAQLELLVETVVLYGARDRERTSHTESSGLNFVIEHLVVPSLNRTQESGQRTDDNQLLFGMRTFLGICREYEALFFKPGPEVIEFNPKVVMEPRLQRYARKLGPQLSALLTDYTTELTRNDQPPASAAQVAIALVHCMPRTIPLMPYEKLQKCLLTLIVGMQKEVREAAQACFLRFVRMWPPLRLTIVKALCETIVRHKDSGTSHDNNRILCAVRSLQDVVYEWTALGNFTRRTGYDDGSVGTFHGIREDWAGSAKNENWFVTDPSVVTVVIDSTALYLLCSTHPVIRLCGFDLLQSSDGLDERLMDGSNVQRDLSTVQVLEQATSTIIERADVGTSSRFGTMAGAGTLSQLAGLVGGNQEPDAQDQVRWCRCLGEICALVTSLRFEVASSFWDFAALAARDAEPSLQGLGSIHKWRNYTVAALSSVDRQAPSKSWLQHAHTATPTQQELVAIVVEVLHSPNQQHRSASVLVLGLVSHPVVFEKTQPTLAALNAASMTPMEDQKVLNPELMQAQLRTDLMTVHRILAERMQLTATQNTTKIVHLLSFVEFTLAYTNSTEQSKNTQGMLWELRTLRVDFCSVVQYVAEAAYDGTASLFKADLRRRTFQLLSEWCAYGMGSGEGRERRRKLDAEHDYNLVQLQQVEDKQKRRDRIARYQQLLSHLEEAAHRTMCYLFWGSAMDEKDPGLIFKWSKYVFQEVRSPALWGPMCEAMENHLVSNPSLLSKYIDVCYDTEHLVDEKSTRALYLNAITAACDRKLYSEDADLAALWLLALFHSATGASATRRAAVLLSQVLAGNSHAEGDLKTPRVRARMDSSELFAAIVTSDMQDTYESQSHLLSSHLSVRLPDFSGRFLLEVFRRMIQPELGVDGRNQMITMLIPWMENFVLADYRRAASPTFSPTPTSPGSPGSDVSELLSTNSKDLETSQVLNCIFSLTQSFGVDHATGIQMIWRSVVVDQPGNVVPIVMYCIDKVVDTYENDPDGVFALVARKVTLYMARCHMDLTLRTLMDQVSMLPATPVSSVSRSNIATILLIEIVHESSAEYLGDHTPLLLHLAVLGMDHDDGHYAELAARLLANLLQTMVLKALAHEQQMARQSSACDKAWLLIQFLESCEVQDIWSGGDLNASGTGQPPPVELHWAINSLVDSMAHTVPDLRERWSHLALHYPLMDRREEVVVRSHQIFRFLRHEFRLQHAKPILFASHAYCQVGRDGSPFLAETAATVGYVMQEHGNTDELERLCILFPQFFWFAVALCQADTPFLYITGLRLLRQVLPTYAARAVARRSLHAGLAAAKTWSRPFRGVQELIVRGLGTAQTEEHAIETLRLLLSLPLSMTANVSAAADPLFRGEGNFSVQLVGGLLPWLCHHLEEASVNTRVLHADAVRTASDLADFCNANGLPELAPSFHKYAERASSSTASALTATDFLQELCEPFQEAMVGVGIAGSVYGPWLAHLGPAPAGLHPRRYARQVLQVLLAVLRNPTHLLASRMTSAEAEAAVKVGRRAVQLAEDAILPLLVKRVSEFAAVRDLSAIAVDVLSVAAIAQERHSLNTGDGGRGARAITMHALDLLVVGKADQFDDEELEGTRGKVIQAWTRANAAEEKPKSRWDQLHPTKYLSLQLGDEIVLTSPASSRIVSVVGGGEVQSWSNGYIAKRRTASGLLVPLSSRAEGQFPSECVELTKAAGTSADDSDSSHEHTHENHDTTHALHAICLTLPGAASPSLSESDAYSKREGATKATCAEHARWLRLPVVIPSQQAQTAMDGGLQLKPRFSVASGGAGSTTAAGAGAGRAASSSWPHSLRWSPSPSKQKESGPPPASPERFAGALSSVGGVETEASPLPSTLGGPQQGGGGKNTQQLMQSRTRLGGPMRMSSRTRSTDSEDEHSMGNFLLLLLFCAQSIEIVGKSFVFLLAHKMLTAVLLLVSGQVCLPTCRWRRRSSLEHDSWSPPGASPCLYLLQAAAAAAGMDMCVGCLAPQIRTAAALRTHRRRLRGWVRVGGILVRISRWICRWAIHVFFRRRLPAPSLELAGAKKGTGAVHTLAPVYNIPATGMKIRLILATTRT
jgi:hypothetical protein